jgi:hypothetical protein
VDVGDGAAAFAHEVVVRVLCRRLVVRAIGAEVGTCDEAFVDEQVERAVDRRGAGAWELGLNAFDEIVSGEVSVRLGDERFPDQLPLLGQPAALAA